MAVGKWHLTPRNDRTASGPFDTWPLGVGFERYYGFLHGDANQWTPTLVSDNHYVDAPRRPEDGYHLTEDLIDTSLRFVFDQQHAAPGKPFFLYLAPGAMHAPHHVTTEWFDRYRGRFDDGWERWRDRAFARQLELGVVPAGTELPARPAWIEPWDGLPADERRLFARFQEVFAGFLTHFDAQLGRLVAGLEELGVLDDTILMLMSDNGASAEGGRIGSINEHRFGFGYVDDLAENLAGIDDLGGWRAYNHYPWGWAWAGNTPFRLWKRYTWLGGTRTPLMVRYPRRDRRRGRRPSAVLPHRRSVPDGARRVRDRRARRRRRCRATARRRREPSRDVCGSRRARGPRHPVLRDARVAVDLPRRLEGDDRPRLGGRARRASPRRQP